MMDGGRAFRARRRKARREVQPSMIIYMIEELTLIAQRSTTRIRRRAVVDPNGNSLQDPMANIGHGRVCALNKQEETPVCLDRENGVSEDSELIRDRRQRGVGITGRNG